MFVCFLFPHFLECHYDVVLTYKNIFSVVNVVCDFKRTRNMLSLFVDLWPDLTVPKQNCSCSVWNPVKSRARMDVTTVLYYAPVVLVMCDKRGQRTWTRLKYLCCPLVFGRNTSNHFSHFPLLDLKCLIQLLDKTLFFFHPKPGWIFPSLL